MSMYAPRNQNSQKRTRHVVSHLSKNISVSQIPQQHVKIRSMSETFVLRFVR